MPDQPVRRRYAPSTVGTLRGFLEGLQGFSAVVHELLQNAEDAGASAFYMRLTEEALWVGNDEEFSDENFVRLANPASGGKRHDVEKIGSFGIGFISVFQLTDAPEIMSRGERHVLLPMEDSEAVTTGISHEWPTTIRLPWALTPSPLRDGLDAETVRPDQFPEFLREAQEALRASAIFLDSVKLLRLMQADQVVEEIQVTQDGGMRTLTSLSGTQVFRLYSGTVDETGVQHLVQQQERKSEVTVAVPVHRQETFRGRFYAYLPTQDLTLLPFHVNADFYPQTDRKSLIWDGNDSIKPVDQREIEFRRRLLEYALERPALLKGLRDVRWLPDDEQRNWHCPGDLWPAQRKSITGKQREQGKAFVGLEIADEDLAEVGLSEPTIATVISHLATLKPNGMPVPIDALTWLNQCETMSPEAQQRLRALPLLGSGPGDYRPAAYFFRGSHDLAPFRGQLSPIYVERFPRLITFLGIREKPSADDYAAVLVEIADKLPDSGVADRETIETIKLCLEMCGREWNSLPREEKEKGPQWLLPLRRCRIIPVVHGERTYAYRPKDAFIPNVSKADIERYKLHEMLAYCADQARHVQFLDSLGVRDLKRSLQKKLLSRASDGTTSAYTRQLKELMPSLIRYLLSTGRSSPEQLEKELDQWRFVSLPEIKAEVSVQGFSTFRPRVVTLEFEVEPKEKAILLSYDCKKYAPGVALQRALRLEQDDLLLTMFADPANAEELLDTKEIPPLPPTFQPRKSAAPTAVYHPELPQEPQRPPAKLPRPPSASAPSQPPQEGETQERGRPGVRQEHVAQPADEGRQAPRGAVPAAPSPPPSGPAEDGTAELGPPFTPEAARRRTQESAQNAAGRKDRLASGLSNPQPPRAGGGYKRAPSGRRKGRLHYRSFVHVAPQQSGDGQASEHNQKVDAIGTGV